MHEIYGISPFKSNLHQASWQESIVQNQGLVLRVPFQRRVIVVWRGLVIFCAPFVLAFRPPRRCACAGPTLDTRALTHMYTHAHTNARTRTHTLSYTHTHTHKHTCTHTSTSHTHTHMPHRVEFKGRWCKHYDESSRVCIGIACHQLQADELLLQGCKIVK